MVILLLFNFLGLLISLLVHLFIFFKLNCPSNELAIVLNIFLFSSFGIRLFITNDLRQGDECFFGKSLKGICPSWLKILASTIIGFGIVSGIVNVFRMVSLISLDMDDFEFKMVMRFLFMGVFSLIMGCYAMEFLHVYLYKILKERNIDKLKKDGTVW